MSKYLVSSKSCVELVSIGMVVRDTLVDNLYREMLSRPRDIKVEGTIEDLAIEFTSCVKLMCSISNDKYIRGCFTFEPFVKEPVLLIINRECMTDVKNLYDELSAILRLAVCECSKSARVKQAFSEIGAGSVDSFVEVEVSNWHNMADIISMYCLMAKRDLNQYECDLFRAMTESYKGTKGQVL